MDVVATAGVHAAHVDALDRAGLGALEAGLALERAPLVVEQLQAAAELGRDVVARTSGYMTVTLGSKKRRRVRAMPLAMPRPGMMIGSSSRRAPSGSMLLSTTMAAAVTNRLSSDAGSSHFQAKSMSWSMRTRGSVPRIHTKVNTKT